MEVNLTWHFKLSILLKMHFSLSWTFKFSKFIIIVNLFAVGGGVEKPKGERGRGGGDQHFLCSIFLTFCPFRSSF